jgi:hypothetical protein
MLSKLFPLLTLLLTAALPLAAQNIIVMKLDGDNRMDTMTLDRQRKVIVCALSTQQYKHMESRPIELLNRECTLYNNGAGFDFRNDNSSGGYHCHFVYNAKTRHIDLAAISRYDAGDPSGDGSGKSDLDLAAKRYTGTWNYYDQAKNTLVALPEIRVTMDLPATTLETFSHLTYAGFGARCTALYRRELEKAREGK